MNFKMIRYITGQLLLVEGALMLLPLVTSLIYREYKNIDAFIIPIVLLFLIGLLFTIRKPENKTLGAKEGFVIVGMSWIVMSLFGALPYVISDLIPNYIDAFFETVSGFTTTGASVLATSDFDKLWSPVASEVGLRGVFLWRSFTNWIGGMGILVFVLAVMPQQDMKSARLVHIMRAEMPGPKVDKLVATVRKTAAITYAIYIVMTAVQIIMLIFGGMDLYEASLVSFSTAGTGGFSIWADGMATYGGVAHPAYCTWVVTVFMVLFSINFNLYYLIITGRVLTALFSEELRWFLGVYVAAVTMITVNIFSLYHNDLGVSIRESAFQVASIMSTSGFTTTNFDTWPNLSKIILLICMFIGGCAGSTCGGIKISRLVIAAKGTWANIRRMIRPRQIKAIRFESKTLDEETVRGSFSFLITYVFIFFGSFLLIALFDGQSIETSFSAVATSLNNVGPGFGKVGPANNFAFLSYASKIVLSLDMLLGRLEIFPIIFLFSPSVWRDR